MNLPDLSYLFCGLLNIKYQENHEAVLNIEPSIFPWRFKYIRKSISMRSNTLELDENTPGMDCNEALNKRKLHWPDVATKGPSTNSQDCCRHPAA